jgi:hypothetical protein
MHSCRRLLRLATRRTSQKPSKTGATKAPPVIHDFPLAETADRFRSALVFAPVSKPSTESSAQAAAHDGILHGSKKNYHPEQSVRMTIQVVSASRP